MQTVRDISREWDKLFDTIEVSSSIRAYHATSSRGDCVGRPRFQVSREQLVYLRSLNFSWSGISRLLGVSWYTVYRRRDEFRLSEEPSSTMTDAQMEIRVHEIRRDLPTFGEGLVIGTLRSSGRTTRIGGMHIVYACACGLSIYTTKAMFVYANISIQTVYWH